jgi:hypothetical protein
MKVCLSISVSSMVRGVKVLSYLHSKLQVCLSISVSSMFRGVKVLSYLHSKLHVCFPLLKGLAHMTGQPPKSITQPVRDKTLLRRWVCYLFQIPAKLESTYISKGQDSCWLKDEAVSFASFKYHMDSFTASSWITFG